MNSKPDARGATTSLNQMQTTLPARILPEAHRNWARDLTLIQDVDTISSSTAGSRAAQYARATQVLGEVSTWEVDVWHGASVVARAGLEQHGATA